MRARAVAVAAVTLVGALSARATADKKCGTPVDAPPTTSDGGVAALGNHLYWIAGTDGAPTTLARRFDVRTKKWETLPEMSGARIHPTVVAASGAIYVIGGVGPRLLGLGDVQRFDPKKCRWSSVGNLTWAPGSPAVTVLGDRLVVAGGRIDNGARSLGALNIWSSDTAASIDADGRSKALPTLARARSDGAAVTVGDAVWVIGGRFLEKDVDSLGSTVDDVEILAPGAKEWTTGKPLPFRAEVFAVALADKTVVVFGRGVMESDRPAIYDPGKNAWREAKDRGEKLEFLEGAAVIAGTIYVLGKEIPSGGKHTYRVATYDPKKDRWVIVNEVLGRASLF